VAAAPEYCPVLVSGAALAGHRSVEGGVEVGRTVGSGISGGNSLGDEVSLLPAGLPVHLPQLLMLPHGEQDL